MIALGLRYLTGRSVATEVATGQAEWPPHPARVFMALAAAHFESGGDAGEREALTWLEQCPPPRMRATEASRRTIYETYVPVNDVKSEKAWIGRPRQPRTFPSVRPDSEQLYLVWDQEPTPAMTESLRCLCRKVTRVGHSSSLVQAWIAEEAEVGTTNWVPDETASQALRVAEPGLLDYLEKRHGQSNRPLVSSWKNYRQVLVSKMPLDEVARSPFDGELIVLERVGDGRTLGLEATLQLTGALRNAVLKAAPTPAPEWLSGHQADGTPSRYPHVAFFPLAFVDHPHADGHVMGMALALPRELRDAKGSRETAVRQYLGSLLFDEEGRAKLVQLWHKEIWKWSLRLAGADHPSQTLSASTWTAASHFWRSVTPVVLHHYPKKNRENDVERIVREAFHSAGFPQPLTVRLRTASACAGAPSGQQMAPYSEGGDNHSRYQVHVAVEFEQRVEGPVLVGRGRFRGYGMFRPGENLPWG